VGEVGLCTSSRCPLETGLRSWPTQRCILTRQIDQLTIPRTLYQRTPALFFWRFARLGPLPPCKGDFLPPRSRLFGQRLGGGRILERIHRPSGGQSTATGRVLLWTLRASSKERTPSIYLWYSSEECTNRTAAPLGVYAERNTALAMVFHFSP
jgi:hypothetical protein